MIPFRTRQMLRRILVTLLVLVLIAAVVLGCWVLWLDRYVIYTRDGVKLDFDLPPALNPGKPAVPPTPGKPVDIVYQEDIDVGDPESPKMTQLSGFYADTAMLTEQFDTVAETLRQLSRHGIMLATLSDVPYGMDNAYVLDDIAPLLPYIRWPLTSNDVGCRKPRIDGVLLLAELMGVKPAEMLFVGDEEKDMLCARKAGACPVLINRERVSRQFGQAKEISSLRELEGLFEIPGRSGCYAGEPAGRE